MYLSYINMQRDSSKIIILQDLRAKNKKKVNVNICSQILHEPVMQGERLHPDFRSSDELH